ncbi:hypothetical protein EON65_48165, partial [archaeon]
MPICFFLCNFSSTYHATEEDYVSHYATFHSKFRYTTKSTDLHPYVVSMPVQCKSECHGFFQQQVGRQHYQVLSEDLGLIFTTHDKLVQLQAEHPNRLAKFIPYSADMKIAPEIKRLEINPADCLSARNSNNNNVNINGKSMQVENPGAALMVTLFHPTEEQLKEFTQHLYGVINKYNGVITYTPDPT